MAATISPIVGKTSLIKRAILRPITPAYVFRFKACNFGVLIRPVTPAYLYPPPCNFGVLICL